MKAIRDNFFYVTLIVLLGTLIVSGYLYFKASKLTPQEYENTLVAQRNVVITQLDTLTNKLNSTSHVEEIEVEIIELREQNDLLEGKIKDTQGARDLDELKDKNLKFTAQIESIIETALMYSKSFDDEEIDVVEVLEKYNSQVSQLNDIVGEIRQEVE